MSFLSALRVEILSIALFFTFLNSSPAQLSQFTTWKEDLGNGNRVACKLEDGDFLYLGGRTATDLDIHSPWVSKIGKNGKPVWHSDESWPHQSMSRVGVTSIKKANNETLLCIDQLEPSYSWGGFAVVSLNTNTGKVMDRIRFNERPAGIFPSTDTTFFLVIDRYSSSPDSITFLEYSTAGFNLLRKYSHKIEDNDYRGVTAAFDGNFLYATVNNRLISLDVQSFTTVTEGPLLKVGSNTWLNEIELLLSPENDLFAYSRAGYLAHIQSSTLDTLWTLDLELGTEIDPADFEFRDSSLYLSTFYGASGGYGPPAFTVSRVNYRNPEKYWGGYFEFDSIPSQPGYHTGCALDLEFSPAGNLYAGGFYVHLQDFYAGLLVIEPAAGQKLFETTFADDPSGAYDDRLHAIWFPDGMPAVVTALTPLKRNDEPMGYQLLDISTFFLEPESKTITDRVRIPMAHHFGSYLRTTSSSPQGTFVVRQRGLVGEALLYDRDNNQAWLWSIDTLLNSYALGGATVNGYHYVLMGFDNGRYRDPRDIVLQQLYMYKLDRTGKVVRVDVLSSSSYLYRNFYNRFEVFTEGNQIFFAEYEEDPDDWTITLLSYNTATNRFNLGGSVDAHDGTFDRFHRNIVKAGPGQYYVVVQNSSVEHVFRPLKVDENGFTLETFTLSGYIKPEYVRDATPYATDTLLMVGGFTKSQISFYHPSTRKMSVRYQNTALPGNTFNVVQADRKRNRINVFGLTADSLMVNIFSRDSVKYLETKLYKLTDGESGYITKSYLDPRDEVFYVSGYTERTADKHRAVFMMAFDTLMNAVSAYFGEYLPENAITRISSFRNGKVLLGGNYRDSTERYAFINLADLTAPENTAEELEIDHPLWNFSDGCSSKSDVTVQGKIFVYGYGGTGSVQVRLAVGNQTFDVSAQPLPDNGLHSIFYNHTFPAVPQGTYRGVVYTLVNGIPADSAVYPVRIGAGYCDVNSGALYVDMGSDCYFSSGWDYNIQDSIGIYVNDKLVRYKGGYSFLSLAGSQNTIRPIVYSVLQPDGKYKVYTPSCGDTIIFTSPTSYHIGYQVADSVPSAVAELQEGERILIAPNPTSGEFDLTFSGPLVFSQLAVTDVSGRVVFRTEEISNSMRLDLSSLPPGIYQLVLFGESGNRFGRIVIR